MTWYKKHARALPWRETRDPYAIWISEIMLQQTQVATVIPYYTRFLKRFPTVAELAAASERDVLRLWEGLGYYRRARQLHAAANRIANEHDGEFPSNLETVRRLPGIGRYTAGAILSFAFDAPLPILEANTIRLFARLLAFRGDPRNAVGQNLLWEAAEAILSRRGSGAINQALMELGSQVCTPREPSCPRCPLASLCLANRDGLQQAIPRPKPKPRIEHVREAAVVVRSGNRVLLVQRADGERWAGLWDFPRFAVPDGAESPANQLAAAVGTVYSLDIDVGKPLTTLRHGVTRFRITLDVFGARLRTRSSKMAAVRDRVKGYTVNDGGPPHIAELRWVRIGELSTYPLNTTGRKIAQRLESR